MSLRANSFAHCFTFYWPGPFIWLFQLICRFDCVCVSSEHTGNHVMNIIQNRKKKKNPVWRTRVMSTCHSCFFCGKRIFGEFFGAMLMAQDYCFSYCFSLLLYFSVLYHANQAKSIYHRTATTTDGLKRFLSVYRRIIAKLHRKLSMS